MKGYDYESYRQITEIIFYLNHETKPTIKCISDKSKQSLKTTRNIIVSLHKSGITMEFSNCRKRIDEVDTDCSEFDNVPIRLVNKKLPGELTDLGANEYLLFLSPIERRLFFRNDIKTQIRIKDTMYTELNSNSRMNMPSYIKCIEEAIQRQCFIKFRYKSTSASMSESIKIAPKVLYHNTANDLMYCLAFRGERTIDAYRLDRIIHSMELLEEEIDLIDKADPHYQRVELVWGDEFNNEEDPVDVKLRIDSRYMYVIKRIKADTRTRTHAIIEQQGDNYIYTDTIVGRSSFCRWVMLFGKTVKIIEPLDMAREVYLSLKMKMLNYEVGTFSQKK